MLCSSNLRPLCHDGSTRSNGRRQLRAASLAVVVAVDTLERLLEIIDTDVRQPTPAVADRILMGDFDKL